MLRNGISLRSCARMGPHVEKSTYGLIAGACCGLPGSGPRSTRFACLIGGITFAFGFRASPKLKSCWRKRIGTSCKLQGYRSHSLTQNLSSIPAKKSTPSTAVGWFSGIWRMMPDICNGPSDPPLYARTFASSPKTCDIKWSLNRVALVYRLPTATSPARKQGKDDGTCRIGLQVASGDLTNLWVCTETKWILSRDSLVYR